MQQSDPEGSGERGFDVVPILLLVAVVAVIVGVWWIFPLLQHTVFLQDCVATGRTNCS